MVYDVCMFPFDLTEKKGCDVCGKLCKSGHWKKIAEKQSAKICIPHTHTHTPPHSEHHFDISCSAHNDNNKRCLIYSQRDLNSTLLLQSLPACSTAAQLASSDLPLVRFPWQSQKGRARMLLINPQNKTCYDYFCTWGQHRRGINRFTKQIPLLIMLFGKKKALRPLDLTVELWQKYLLDYQRGEEGWRRRGRQTDTDDRRKKEDWRDK